MDIKNELSETRGFSWYYNSRVMVWNKTCHFEIEINTMLNQNFSLLTSSIRLSNKLFKNLFPGDLYYF